MQEIDIPEPQPDFFRIIIEGVKGGVSDEVIGTGVVGIFTLTFLKTIQKS